MNDAASMCMQITALEKNGGTILGGAIKLLRDKKKNPGPPRDPSLPPKPKGQTVGSFTGGLRMLPDAIARKMQSKLRCKCRLMCCITKPHLVCHCMQGKSIIVVAILITVSIIVPTTFVLTCLALSAGPAGN